LSATNALLDASFVRWNTACVVLKKSNIIIRNGLYVVVAIKAEQEIVLGAMISHETLARIVMNHIAVSVSMTETTIGAVNVKTKMNKLKMK